MPRIRWINHAGFVLEGGGAVILCDPWLEGTVFNNGWELLAPNEYPVQAFEDVTHVWFSHEHPDHFNPRSIRRIMPAIARAIVLFQRTADGRVLDWCTQQGLSVQELPDRVRTTIAPEAHVTVGKNGVEDSWAVFELGGRRVLDLNDCLFTSVGEIRALAAQIGAVEGLMSQFSYAEKIGNIEDGTLRQATAKHYRERLLQQIEAFQPKWVIPMASFKYFSHPENFYLNDGSSKAREVMADLTTQSIARPVTLFPGDMWSFEEPNDNEVAVSRYEACEAGIVPKVYDEQPVPLAELERLSAVFLDKLEAANRNAGLFWLARRLPFPAGLPQLSIWLADLKLAGELSVSRPFRRVDLVSDACELQTTSPNLAYLFQHLSGANALMINGRYQATKSGNLKLFVFAHLALMASAGAALSLRYVFRNLTRIVLQALHRITRS